LKKNNISYSPKNLYHQEITLDEGIALGRVLGRRKDISAVFATADILAAGIISGLTQTGRQVPGDISIIGFDDIYYSRATSPPLTTIHQDMEERGVVAAGLMADCLEGKQGLPSNITMPVKVVERYSVRSFRKKS
jgi:LacI family transcriptional regulator